MLAQTNIALSTFQLYQQEGEDSDSNRVWCQYDEPGSAPENGGFVLTGNLDARRGCLNGDTICDLRSLRYL